MNSINSRKTPSLTTAKADAHHGSAIMSPMHNDIQQQLDSLARDSCYRVDSVLKQSDAEVTQKVYFVGSNGAEQGPYIRKYFDAELGLGTAYKRIFDAQKNGGRFKHLPRIIDCYDAGEKRAVILEFIHGETLADAVYDQDPSVELTAKYFPSICDAIGELHTKFTPPLIHRDLKPSNIMVQGDNVFIIDFGIARSFDENANEDTVHFGTRAYAPPEQFGYGQTDERSDVYALGIVAYYLLREATPSAEEVRNGFKDAGLPDALRAVIAKASAFDPKDRFESAAALKRAFGQAVEQTGGQTDEQADEQAVKQVASEVPPQSFSWKKKRTPQNAFTQSLSQVSPSAGNALSGAITGVKRAFGRIPLGVGVAIDICIVAWTALVVLAGVGLLINPGANDNTIMLPFVLQALAYLAAMVIMSAPAWLFFDRRLVVKHVKAARGFTYKQQVCIVAILMAVALLIVVIVVGIMPLSFN